MPANEALAMLGTADQFHVASVLPDGTPMLKTLHGVVDDGWLCFHSAPKGEKTSMVGQPVVAGVEEVVARIPSYFLDPLRACPATTLYRSVQVHGVMQAIDDAARKARVLEALMRKLQPQGGYTSIEAEHPLYKAAVRGLLVGGVALTAVEGKAKLAQNRSLTERTRLLEQLWQRGAPGDARAIEFIRAANPDVPGPFASPQPELTLHGWLDPGMVDAAVALVQDHAWNEGVTAPALRVAHLSSTAWVGAKNERGELIATARAITDSSKAAWVYEVCVAKAHRRRGLGRALVLLLLGHPAVRNCRRVLLATRDAQSLYARCGFVVSPPAEPYLTTHMTLLRPQRDETA